MRTTYPDRQLTAVDLFSGCGGLTLGLRSAGFRVVGAVEVDPMAARVYEANHRLKVRVSDIRDVDPSGLYQAKKFGRRRLDLLAGCPPCQGFSRMRTLNGARSVDDPRNELLCEFLRFVKVLRPHSIMMENVPGMARDVRFHRFCESLDRCGYVGQYRVVNAADYGVPQRRHRLIFLAGYRVRIPFGQPSPRPKTVKDVIYDVPKAGDSGDYAHDIPERRTQKVKSMIRHIPKDGGSRRDLPKDLRLACHDRCGGFGDVYGRLSWGTVASTITGGCFNPSKGRFLHPEEDRAITIREAALLQGFPADYDFLREFGKEALARMVGNALPPPFVEAHSRSIRDVILRTIHGVPPCRYRQDPE